MVDPILNKHGTPYALNVNKQGGRRIDFYFNTLTIEV